jgi:hypothetical protein
MFSYESNLSRPNCADVYTNKLQKKSTRESQGLYSYFLNSDYSDEYYSDYDEYSSDPDFAYTDTLCYHPGISNRSSCSSGAFHPGVSPQPGKSQPKPGAGESLVKQDPQNRSYPIPRKARKRYKKKHPYRAHIQHL